MSMVDSTKMLCPLYYEIDIFYTGRENDLIEHSSVHQTSVAAQRRHVRLLSTRMFSNPAAECYCAPSSESPVRQYTRTLGHWSQEFIQTSEEL